MEVKGKKVRVPKWIHGELCVLHLDIEAIVPEFDPSQTVLTPSTVRFLDQLQRMANEGKIDELSKHGTVYVRKSA